MTKGSQITLYAANQSHRKLHKTVVEWVLDEIAKVDIHGATVTDVSEGIDAHGRYHAARFFELIDQPVAITVIALALPSQARRCSVVAPRRNVA